MAVTIRLGGQCYRFICPECGMGDQELGHLASEDDVHCIVCLVDADSYVRLRRWRDEPEAVARS